MKRTGLAVIAAALLLTGCGTAIGENDSIAEVVTTADTTAEVTETVSAADSEEESTSVLTAPSEKTIVSEEPVYKKFSKTFEAEELKLEDGMKTAKKRSGYSGKGYVTGLDASHTAVFSAEIPVSQYYNISAAVAADTSSSCTITVGGVTAGDFKVSKGNDFTLVTMKNIYIEKGTEDIALLTSKGKVELDYIKVEASSDVKELQLGLKGSKLINKNADYNAQALYNYLCESYGSRVLTGQHDTVGSMTETRKIYELTERFPAIRFGDLMPFTQDMIIGENELEYAERWADEGGIVSYMWHWYSPTDGSSCYADETDFDITKAVTKEKIYSLSDKELVKLRQSGKISEQCLAIVRDIDKISEKLGELQKKGIAVIWRPLHEASNGYFWWGHDKESYLWLWKLLYQRQTEYHKLNNLIWVWSAQDAGWYVGDELCDIISVDIYDQGNVDGQVEKLLYMKDITSKKPIAMSECGTTPSIQSIADLHAFWSYIGQWGGSYLLGEDGELNEEYNTLESLVKFYSNDLTVARDELPDLKARAMELEAAARDAAAKPAETTAAADEKAKEKETKKTTGSTTTKKSADESEKKTTTKKSADSTGEE